MNMILNTQKITGLYENKIVTRPERGESGQLRMISQEIRYKRGVQSLSVRLRLVNLIIDVTFFRILAYVLGDIEVRNSIPYSGVLFIFSFPIYYLMGEYFFQRTIGKFFTKSIVLNEYGDKLDFRTAFIRTVVRFIPFEFLSFLAFNRGWHDKWTDTYVISEKEFAKKKN